MAKNKQIGPFSLGITARSKRRVQGVGFWCPLKKLSLGYAYVPVSPEQWRTVEALVGTVISPCTQQLLTRRGYRMLLQHDSRDQTPTLLMEVMHPAGLGETRQGV